MKRSRGAPFLELVSPAGICFDHCTLSESQTLFHGVGHCEYKTDILRSTA